jgi:hypothetical protein
LNDGEMQSWIEWRIGDHGPCEQTDYEMPQNANDDKLW